MNRGLKLDKPQYPPTPSQVKHPHLAARFGHDVLADIQATVPPEPGTAARVAEALTISSPWLPEGR